MVEAKPYQILVAPAARRQLKELPKKKQKLFFEEVGILAFNPRPSGIKKIEGMSGLHVMMTDHFRVLYKIDDPDVLVLSVVER